MLNIAKGFSLRLNPAVGVLLLLGAARLSDSTTPTLTPQSTPTPPPASDAPEELPYPEIVAVVPRYLIRAILNHKLLPVEEVPPFFRDEEMVIGVTINGDARAYPVAILSQHEVANDVVGGMPVAITW